ncbi:MAG: D-glycero-beta-D-manno-heptose 1-phosphate adenylyltransferase [Spirochaetota bacterium]
MFPERIQEKIVPFPEVVSLRQKLQSEKIVFTNGCFDLVHVGHIQYLARARQLGDFLWLGLNSDISVRQLKGETRPIHTEEDRAILLAAFYFVDAVTIFSQNTPIELLSKVRPQLHVKGGDYIAEELPEYDIVVKNGGTVEVLPFLPGKSSTSVIERIQTLS